MNCLSVFDQFIGLELKGLIRRHNELENYAIRFKVSAFKNISMCTKRVTEAMP